MSIILNDDEDDDGDQGGDEDENDDGNDDNQGKFSLVSAASVGPGVQSTEPDAASVDVAADDDDHAADGGG